ncbi:cytoplasmic 60S subunit biogenesis factor ZNF622-like [Saimiri boliviensis]|uniref:cytoplasmic 60S subunit biogenesis factor ZNF622-like n=1 Tax=Saimiri boliviensis TaxID=27679 RepID=UPI003D76DC7E
MQAVKRKVEMINEKNLEKRLHMDSVDKDARNAVIQQVIKALPSMCPKKEPPAPAEESRSSMAMAAGGCVTHNRNLTEKLPQLQWFEQWVKKVAKQQEEDSEEEEDLDEDDWEDNDSDEEL